MTRTFGLLRRRGLELLLLVCVTHLAWLLYAEASALEPGEVSNQRNWDFPNTYIERNHLDLTSPNHYVRLTWAGPGAAAQETGPFRSSPGRGWGTNDCNDPVESNCLNSRCTPKGLHMVEDLRDHLDFAHYHRYVTVIDKERAISFHSHSSVPSYLASMGCVRLEPYAVRLIHDNSIVGKTEILIDGTWTNPKEQSSGAVERKSSSTVERQGTSGVVE